VQENKGIIVDQNTGRLMTGRRWSEGLHQAVEAKEGVEIERETQTLATITIQNYFRLYQKLAGMTGTAETEASEFFDIYKLGVLVIPTNRPIARKDAHDTVYKTKREKFSAVVKEIENIHAQGRPILVGTVSVESSELLSRMLKKAGCAFGPQRQVPRTGSRDRRPRRAAPPIFIATNTGRGPTSNSAQGPGSAASTRSRRNHEARRIDRQLRAVIARQATGSSHFFIGLEDDLMRSSARTRS
jgi:preprotein translocase subunit SecA